MKRIRKAAFFLFGVSLALFAVTPRAGACCRPCQGFCGPGVPGSAFCCQGSVPGDACGLTTCGEFLG